MESILSLEITLIFLICSLAAPWPALGHYQGDSLTHQILIVVFLPDTNLQDYIMQQLFTQ